MGIIYKHARNDVCIPLEHPSSTEEIYQCISEIENIPQKDFYLTINGKCLHSGTLTSPCNLRLHLRLPGGKGGFGSMLRAIGARIEKTTNHEACRDLNGRRMRDVNNEKAIGEWKKQKDGDEEERKQKRIKKLKNVLDPKHNYEDTNYTSNLQMNADKIDDALKAALQKRDEKFGSKRKMPDQTRGKEKKSRMWMGVSDEDESEDSDDGEKMVSVGHDEPCCSKLMMDEIDSCEDKEEFLPISNDYETDEITSEKDKEIPLNMVSDVLLDIGEPSTNTNSVEEENEATKVQQIEGTLKSDDRKTETSTLNNDGEIKVLKLTENVASQEDVPINMEDYESAEQLEAIGLERLKTALMSIGLKCGGTLQERAHRLFLTKHTPLEQLDRSLFAKKGKKK